MSAARNLTDADVEAVAEAVARKLAANTPLPRGKRRPRSTAPLSPEALERAAVEHARRGVPSRR